MTLNYSDLVRKIQTSKHRTRGLKEELGDAEAAYQAACTKETGPGPGPLSARYSEQEVQEARGWVARTEARIEEEAHRLKALEGQLPTAEERREAGEKVVQLAEQASEARGRYWEAWSAFSNALEAAEAAGNDLIVASQESTTLLREAHDHVQRGCERSPVPLGEVPRVTKPEAELISTVLTFLGQAMHGKASPPTAARLSLLRSRAA